MKLRELIDELLNALEERGGNVTVGVWIDGNRYSISEVDHSVSDVIDLNVVRG